MYVPFQILACLDVVVYAYLRHQPYKPLRLLRRYAQIAGDTDILGNLCRGTDSAVQGDGSCNDIAYCRCTSTHGTHDDTSCCLHICLSFH